MINSMKYSSAGQVISINLPLNQFIEYWNKNDTTSLLDGNGVYEVFFKVILLAAKNHFKLLISTYIDKNQYEVTCTVGVWSKINPILIANVDDNNKSSLTLSGNLIVDGTINGTASSAGFILNYHTSLGYRKPNTTYNVGAIAYHSALPTGWYLECTTGGITATGDITPSSTIGGTVTDGTVTWMISRALPISGGTFVTSDEDLFLHLSDTSKAIFMFAAPDTNGAMLQLDGRTRGDSNNNGTFALKANNGSVYANLVGRPNGALTWAGNDLAGSAIVAKSLGANGYIKYASGFIIQWGYASTDANGTKTVTLPISYYPGSQTYRPQITALDPSTSMTSAGNFWIVDNYRAYNQFVVKGPASTYFDWLTIGY